MPSTLSTSVLALASAAAVSAHGFVRGITVDGVYTTGWLVDYAYNPNPPQSIGWSEAALDHGYVPSDKAAHPDIICHLDAKNAELSATVAAGTTIDLHWSGWPDSHRGPICNYMANCNGDCATVDKTTLEWFKVDEKGLEGGVWASDELIANNATWPFPVPASIAPGNYVIRHEIFGLHGAISEGGTQVYPFCINLEVTGSGTENPPGTLGTALYTPTDPGILLNIYVDDLVYPIPGPPVWTPGTTAPPTTDPPATPPVNDPVVADPVQPAADPTTFVTRSSTPTPKPDPTNTPSKEEEVPTNPGGEKYTTTPYGKEQESTTTPQGEEKESTTPPSGTDSTGSGAALYAQCGGQNFSGTTTCASGTCTKLNDYYSQCL
ncbi:hypothetical protein LZ554_000450 [Drepanopeziza brunnea f. sp. 'monogermtubi']|nr:hypothetical protein LZ554_000450 [Drepanopeziza brunnea f. sp. 'monogermtubi']